MATLTCIKKAHVALFILSLTISWMPFLQGMTSTTSIDEVAQKLTSLAEALDNLQKQLLALKNNLITLQNEVHYKNIACLIKEDKEASKKIILILGARPNEEDHFNFANFNNNNVSIIYLDLPTSEWNCFTRFIQGDFNNLTLLTKLAEEFSNSFDLIIPDYSVGKFMHFSVAHLNCFLTLLSSDGKMLFDYSDQPAPTTIDVTGLGKTTTQITQAAKTCCLSINTIINTQKNKNSTASHEHNILLLHGIKPYIINVNHDLITSILKSIKENYDDFITSFTTRFINGRNNVSFIKVNDIFPYWSSRRNRRLNGVPQIGDLKVVLEPRDYFVLEKQEPLTPIT